MESFIQALQSLVAISANAERVIGISSLVVSSSIFMEYGGKEHQLVSLIALTAGPVW